MRTPNVVKKPYIRLRRLFRKKKKAAGLPPGTLVYTGERRVEHVTVNLLDYKSNTVSERIITDPAECSALLKSDTVSWIDVEGLHETHLIQNIGESLGLHPLVMEDILNVDQRAKMEEFDNYVYIVLKMFHLKDNSSEITPEQVSIVLGKNFVATFQEGIEGDTFHEIRERIRNNKGIITKMTPDYLVYSIIDSIIDSYFSVLEKFGDRIETLEEELVNDPEKHTLTEIYRLKREMLYLRKSVWPLREAISRLERGESDLITRSTHLYLRDVYDHTINVLDTIETYRDMLSGMIDIYLSSISNRLNETMKYLALISTIFIPMTFIASIYGMNFEYMPELVWVHGYKFALGVMFAVGIGFFIYFKRKKWV
jgi:magnesium transporter